MNRDTTPNTNSLIELDLKAYAPYLESADISEEAKRELIETLWSIVVSFVQLGYGLTPAQQVLDSRSAADIACGQVSEIQEESPFPGSDLVEYSPSIIEKFVSSAHADDEEGVSA